MFILTSATKARHAMAVCAFSLLVHYAAADSLISTSGNFVGGAINNFQNNVGGGALPPRNGSYYLEAFAHDSLVRPDVDNKINPAYGSPAPGTTLSDSQTADANGTAFDAHSVAQITYPVTGRWNSNGSYASVCGPADAGHPQGNKANCGKNPNGENAEAKAIVRDPWNFDVSSFALTIDNVVTFSDGLSLQAWADGSDFARASIVADASTDLNGLGELWKLYWSTDSTHPGVAGLTFWSNPALGLNDAVIANNFRQLLSGDSSTGLNTLTQSFSFDYQLTIPANTSAQFTASVAYDAAGATGVPEPAALMMVGAGLIALGLCRFKRLADRQSGY